MKGVFEISGTSRYDDLIAERYHFPANYLPVARACVGDWIVHRETGAAGGRMPYVATGASRHRPSTSTTACRGRHGPAATSGT